MTMPSGASSQVPCHSHNKMESRMTGTEGRLRSSVKKQVSGITLQLRDQQGKEGQTQQSTENKT